MNKPLHRHLLAWAAVAALAGLAAPAQAQSAADGKRPSQRAAKAKAPAPKPKAPAAAAPAAAAAAVPAAAASAPAAAPSPADYIVAVVNTEPITNNEVRARVARALREMGERGMVPPPAATLRKEMLERLISERAQLQYARELGLTVDDATLEQAELSIARQNQLATVPELYRRIEQEGISVKDFRADVRNQVLLSRLREREIEPRIRVTDADVDAYIREQTGAQTAVPEVNLAMILVEVPENASADEVARLQKRADEAAEKARAGEDFAKLAAEYSDANNRGRDGGVLGLHPLDKYPELFVKSTQGVRVGGIVGPVRSPAGFHILKVLERKINRDLPEVKIPLTHVRGITLKVGPTQSVQVARDRLADIKRRIESGQATFEQLARQYSQDDGAATGGDLGWVPPGQFVPQLERVVGNLDAGQISDPVVTPAGVQLVQVEGRREQVLTSAQQRQLARNVLREKKAEEAFDTWSKEVRGRAYVEYREPPQ
ncbi:peptidylprolyl isomerase [Ottowia pentelensis]|uniref:peptidylprolyl isomerase n=1 Tax=Ottowia pentelensis TaxID=511108 RepID=UPI00361A59EE